MFNYFFALVPSLEVVARMVHWRTRSGYWFLSKLKSYRRPRFVGKIPSSGDGIKRLEGEIASHGITAGDTLIVHSSMLAISQLGLSASDVINLLVRQIGESGTLVMPAFPRYRESLDEFEYQSKEEIEEVWTYDVQRTPPWTGALPYALIKKKGSVRSRFPLNTVVAYGKNAEEMIRHELDLDGATPCGPNSAWGYCAKNNAKILMLGVDLAHNLTMIHVAEDCFEAKWPIDHWYRFRTFNVKSFGADITVRVRERRPIWSTFYAERLLNRDLFKDRIARVSSLGSLSVISLNSSDLIKYLQTKNSDGYPYKFWRMIQKK